MIFLVSVLTALLLAAGLRALCAAYAGDRSYVGRGTLRKLSKWRRKRVGAWDAFPLAPLAAALGRVMYVDEATCARLKARLAKAGLQISPGEYQARRMLTVLGGALTAALFAALGFPFGVLLAALLTVYGLMAQRDALDAKARRRELAVSQEMPRFVRSICRSLQSDRDLISVIGAYRKVAGPELGGELDILTAEMRAGSVQTALLHFERRLGSPEASRLCGALRDMAAGVDQTATLAYLADDMAQAARETVKKELSLRPEKMRRTYYPAVMVCIAMVMYVLVVYVVHNLNSIS